MSKAFENYQNKRDRIAEAARALFVQSGFAAVSVDDIARKAGVTKQTVYRYYPSKEALFRTILTHCAMAAPAEHVFGDQDVETELAAFGLAFLRFHVAAERLESYRLLVAESGKTAELGEFFYNHGPKKSGALLEAFLRERLPGLEDAKSAAFYFAAMLLHLRTPLLYGLRGPYSEEELTERAAAAARLFVHGAASCGRAAAKPETA